LKSNSYIGEFEELVLLAILSQGDNAYGVPIRRALEDATGRSVAVGALYATLSRLEEKGLISSRTGESTPERGGRAKRYFEVKSNAKAKLREVNAARERLKCLESSKEVA
jgi:PadR family transcriptional regulator PadR